MKAFDRAAAAAVLVVILIFASVNIYFAADRESSGRPYRVEIARAAAEMENGDLDLSGYPSITAVVPVEDDGDLLGGNDDYLIREVNGKLYRFDYSVHRKSSGAAVNTALAVMAAVMLVILALVRQKVLMPFIRLRDLPYELSKGNLNAPINESRYRLFGRFTWGMNLLRENLEKQKAHEHELQAEKKKLIISLSHDIKIPLSAIGLYAKAIGKGLYEPADAARRIEEKAGEIERYVSEIVKASSEDFLSLEVRAGEFYLSEIITDVEGYYSEKLLPLGYDFRIDKYVDCLLLGDRDRGIEVIQNIMENAVKYGDGKEICISFSEEENCRLVSVKNTGCTLPGDELPHIFDSFYRGSNAGSAAGSGLGLYICRTLMRKMNGDIFARIEDGCMTVTAVFSKA